MAVRTQMIRFAMSNIGVGLLISLLLLRLAARIGITGGIIVTAGVAITLFAAAIFRALTK